MSRRGRQSSTVDDIVREKQYGKGRRREWHPRGSTLIPGHKVHMPKDAYQRKNNWKHLLEMEEDDDGTFEDPGNEPADNTTGSKD